MAANSSTQVVSLDFDSLKNNFITYLQSQDTFKDYNFEGSALNQLVDILTYNTQYNAYYLNMVANEMFLDSATQRSSVVSQAKVLNYTPQSAIAPTATVNVTFTNVNTSSLTLPAYQTFSSSAINGVNYTFVNPDSYTVNVTSNTAIFPNVEIKQGVYATYRFTVNSTTNPNYIFQIPDNAIDTTSIQVLVQTSSSNSSYTIFNRAMPADYLTLNSTSQVYFLQEALDGNYEIYFGDGVLGQQLTDGNIVVVNYVSTEGTAAAGANSFVLLNTVSGYSPSAVLSVTPATNGSDKESIDSIKYQAPKTFAAQGRAVSKSDYITAIQQNNQGFSFDAVNVWGGEENNPPVYGQVFVSLKPTGAYNLTNAQKQAIITNIIQPISVLTVTPTIVDPDYTYIKINVNALYDSTKTTLTAAQLQTGITSAIQSFASSTLNTFNSTFNAYDLLSAVQTYDPSIITSEYSIQLQKKFFPNLTTPTTYTLSYNTPLQRGVFSSGISSSPAMQFIDKSNTANIIDGVYLEEVPQETHGIDTISVINPGFNYTSTPTVTIYGDGTDATAVAVLAGGRIQSIIVTNSGNNYTSATATITPAEGDTTGQNAAAVVNLQGRYGRIRSYYYSTNNNVKTILNTNAGTIDYDSGVVTLISFAPLNVDNVLGQLAVSVTPKTSIISSTYNGIITVDPYDINAITVSVNTKTTS
jgi:hypothetical protein